MRTSRTCSPSQTRTGFDFVNKLFIIHYYTGSDGRISYKEFQKMINPPKPPEGPKPTKKDFVQRFSQVVDYQEKYLRPIYLRQMNRR